MANYCVQTFFICLEIFIIFGIIFVTAQNAALQFRISDTLYLIGNQQKLSWHKALDFCRQRNMSLVSFDSQDKLVKLNTVLMKQNFIDRPQIGNEYIYWIGGNDLQQEGHFIWAGTGAKFGYTNWLPGMPDNWRGDEHCVEMGFRVLGRWNDNRCWYRRHFICERTVAADEQLNI